MSIERIELNSLTNAIIDTVKDRAKADADVATSRIIETTHDALLAAARPLVDHAADNAIANAVTDFAHTLRAELAAIIERREVKRITDQLTGKKLI